jgi:ribosomal protein S18 acetylase RimI-like enzyme
MKGRRNVTVAPNPSWRRITMLLSIMLVQAHSWTAVPTVRKQTILREQRTLSQLLHVAPPQQQQQLLQQRSLFALQASSCNDASSKFDSQQDEQQQQQPRQEFTIRSCKYADLKAVSDIIVDSFYTDNMKSSPFAAVLKLGELNRLQQNFPYNDSERHVMLVATTTDSSQDSANPSGSNSGKIVGFVDVDARPATRRIDPPRPYLSDLAVHPDYRRNGIATILIQTCEALVHSGRVRVSATTTPVAEDHPTGVPKREMFIRVERANAAAIQMYEKFDYHAISHSIFGVEDTTVLLHKDFPHY